MKTYSFKLNDEEQEIIDVVTKNSKYKHFKDPKTIFLNSATEALKKIAK
jgi:hypothetical protein